MSNLNIINQLSDNEDKHKSYLEDNINILSGGTVLSNSDSINSVMINYYSNISGGVDTYNNTYDIDGMHVHSYNGPHCCQPYAPFVRV